MKNGSITERIIAISRAPKYLAVHFLRSSVLCGYENCHGRYDDPGGSCRSFTGCVV